MFICKAEEKTELGKRKKTNKHISLSSILFLMHELDSSSVRLEAVSKHIDF